MNDCTVLVLAGGSGVRFWPFSTNKILFPFLGKGAWEYSVRDVLPKYAAEVVIVTSPVNDEVLSKISLPIPVKTIVQERAGGMADAILKAKTCIQTKKLLILIADDFFDPSLPQKILTTAQKTHAFGVIPGWKVSGYFPGGYLQLDGKRVIGIVEKPQITNVPSDRVNISGHYISDSAIFYSVLEQMNANPDERYEAALSILMKDKEFIMHEYDGPFASLKYPWHVLSVMDMVLSGVSPFQGKNCQIQNNVFLEGPVFIGENVKIFENTKIVGPVYIGDNTIIGNNNVIRHSVIGANCVTGFNTDITRSYIGDSCWFHSNYVGDSVLEENVSMGSGSVLANLRLDEGEIYSLVKGERTNTFRTKLGAMIGKSVRIGVNTSIMPGVKIGQHSCIGAGITLSQDVHDNSFVTGKMELQIQENSRVLSGNREKYRKHL
jgi:bifunctional UDP-N-acetylglucosamine pyrophosphorylase/glucosamine-1-phosphate N-acetyltransferase